MSDQENTPIPSNDPVPGGADSPVADAKEDVTATSEEAQKRPEKTPEQKRLAELAFEAREAKRQAKAEAEARERLERELEEARAGKGGAPKAEDFDSYEAYLDARADWLVDQKLKEQSKKSAEDAKKAKAAEEMTRKQARVDSMVSSGASSYKDFDATLQALNEAVANPDDIRGALEVVIESDRAADLMYYLGKNPSVVAKLSGMNPVHQAREIGRLEALFESKKLTNAPAPADTLKGNGGRVTSDTPPTDPEKYRQWRAKQMKG